MSHQVTRLALVLAVPLALTGCGSSAGPKAAAPDAAALATMATSGPDGVQQILIEATDNFRFAPSTIDAHVGQLRIVLVDDGSYPHNISFPALHATSSTVSGTPSQQRKTFTVTFDHAGTYDFVCTFHSSAGMKGRVVVTAAG